MVSDKKKSNEIFFASALSFLILFPMLFWMLPTFVFFCFSMLPTFIVLITEIHSKTKLKYKWLCVGGLNFAGALPFLFQLWFDNNTLQEAVTIFFCNTAFVMIYCSALVGWFFYRFIPAIVSVFLEMSDQRRLVYLQELQTKLIAKWGKEVSFEDNPFLIVKEKISSSKDDFS